MDELSINYVRRSPDMVEITVYLKRDSQDKQWDEYFDVGIKLQSWSNEKIRWQTVKADNSINSQLQLTVPLKLQTNIVSMSHDDLVVKVEGHLYVPGSDFPVQYTDTFTQEWSQSYQNSLAKIKILSCYNEVGSNKKNYLNVTFKAINYFAKADLVDTAAYYWSDFKIFYMTSGEQHYENYDFGEPVYKFKYTGSVRIPVSSANAYSVYAYGNMLCSQKKDDPNIYNITSSSQTSITDDVSDLRNLISIQIRQVSSQTTSNATAAIKIKAIVQNYLGVDWDYLKVAYMSDDDNDWLLKDITEDMDDGKRTVKYNLTGLQRRMDYTLYLVGKATVANADGSTKTVKVRSSIQTCYTASEDSPAQPLLLIKNGQTGEFEDFTDQIKMGTYDVVNSPIEETWDDANYTTHKILVRDKIKGSMEMIFVKVNEYGDYTISREKYYHFLDLIRLSKYDKDTPTGCIQMKVQVNNDVDVGSITDTDLDEYGTIPDRDLSYVRCNIVTANFFIKMDSIPWNMPYYNVGGKEVDSLKIEIEEE